MKVLFKLCISCTWHCIGLFLSGGDLGSEYSNAISLRHGFTTSKRRQNRYGLKVFTRKWGAKVDINANCKKKSFLIYKFTFSTQDYCSNITNFMVIWQNIHALFLYFLSNVEERVLVAKKCIFFSKFTYWKYNIPANWKNKTFLIMMKNMFPEICWS